MNCQTLRTLIFSAYVAFADDHFSPFASVPIEGGRSWIDSERYEINAKSESSPHNHAALNGGMIRALLEDRFKLRLHTETREGPCTRCLSARVVHNCSRSKKEALGRGTTTGFDLYRANLSDLAVAWSTQLDRRVVDRTGIAMDDRELDAKIPDTPKREYGGM